MANQMLPSDLTIITNAEYYTLVRVKGEWTGWSG